MSVVGSLICWVGLALLILLCAATSQRAYSRRVTTRLVGAILPVGLVSALVNTPSLVRSVKYSAVVAGKKLLLIGLVLGVGDTEGVGLVTKGLGLVGVGVGAVPIKLIV